MNLLAERISLQAQQQSSLRSSTTQLFLFGKPAHNVKDSPKSMADKCLDSQLWHACAGGMVQMPPVNSKVYYFAQGHAEHSQSPIDFGAPKIPPFILCRVSSVKFLADPETDEVFAKILLVPVQTHEAEFGEEDHIGAVDIGSDLQEKPASFAKTLTQSDANNGGGFSVPRYCAETIFPKLDYTADPPVQTVLAKDVHGEVWKFRHIYRGTPRRHLLTTGWSTFVNQKKLVAGDSIVFLRAENGDLCVGIRRAKRGAGCGPEQLTGWNPPQAYGRGLSVFLREEEGNNGRMMRGSGGNMKAKSKVRSESVVEAARFAANGQAFEVVYYPRASTPEFCVKAGAVRGAMRVQWCAGMRFKMAFETEDSSRISWFMGTISSVNAADPVHWPNSPWRLLQVTWDEPDLLQNVKRVSPWLVELVSNMPAIHLSPFCPSPRKKLRFPPNPEFSQDPHQFSTLPPTFTTNPHGPFTGIQGARHAHYSGVGGSSNSNTIYSLPDLHFRKLQSGLLHARLESKHTKDDNISCLLTIGSPSTHVNMKKTTQLVLFGQPILTEEQISLSSSSRNSLSGSMASRQEMGQCKVFKAPDDIGVDIDLSVFESYDELYAKLADMFGVEKAEIVGRFCYHDAKGSVKHTVDASFREFVKTARRLTILMEEEKL